MPLLSLRSTPRGAPEMRWRSNMLATPSLVRSAERMCGERPGVDARVIQFPTSRAAASAVSGSRRISLEACPYGARSTNLGGGIFEVYGRRCFANGVGGDIRVLLNHDDGLPLARRSAGTVTVSEDETGVHIECDVAPTSYGDDALTNLRVGIITASSAAFWIQESHFEMIDGLRSRIVDAALLRDVSLVTYPAYPDATASMAAEPGDKLGDLENDELGVESARAKLRSLGLFTIDDARQRLATIKG